MKALLGSGLAQGRTGSPPQPQMAAEGMAEKQGLGGSLGKTAEGGRCEGEQGAVPGTPAAVPAAAAA